jgi:Alpha-2,8-polysialyltransferase (POLYST)
VSGRETNVFCASTLFHLLVLQALARERAELGERNALILTRATLNAEELHLSGFGPYRRLLLDGLWDAVLADEAVTADYDLRALGRGAGAALRVRRAQCRLDAFMRAAAPLRAIYVCNPMTGAVDRRAALWAGRRARLGAHFVEDGTGSYLPSALKHAIDRSYWTTADAQAGPLRRAAAALLGLDRQALTPPPAFDEDLCFQETHVLFPERFPATSRSGRLVALSRERLHETIAELGRRMPPGLAEAGPAHEPLLVYLSRPDSEDGLLAPEDEVRLVGDALLELSAGARVVLKPHPRDRRAKVARIATRAGVEVIDPDPHPAELFLSVVRPAACYGTWSGSLVYARELLGIPAWSLLPTFCGDLAARGRPARALEAILDAFAGLFPELVQRGAQDPGGATRS